MFVHKCLSAGGTIDVFHVGYCNILQIFLDMLRIYFIIDII